MNIKEKIGQRIQEERLAKGLTRKALEELTDDLKQSRISNWERGDRTPGPEEIKQLAKALDVSAAYLMCLTDEKQNQKIPGLGALVPLLNAEQACNPELFIHHIKTDHSTENLCFIPIPTELSHHLDEYAFALKIKDDSMYPELRINDILIIHRDAKIQPGSLIVAKLIEEPEVIVRRYKQLVFTKEFISFELHAENENWGNIKVSNESPCKIIGVVKSVIRRFT